MFTTLILSSLQDFFSRETDFYFHQFLSNFLRYFSSNSLLFHPYNIFTIYFPGSSSLLKSLFSSISNFSYFLTSTFNLPSNSTTTSFAFSKFFSLSQLSCSAINLFHHTKHFSISLIFLLFSIFFYFPLFNFLYFYQFHLFYLFPPNLLFISYYLTNIHNWVNSY